MSLTQIGGANGGVAEVVAGRLQVDSGLTLTGDIDNVNLDGLDIEVGGTAVSNSNPVPVSDSGGSLTVDGTVSVAMGGVAVSTAAPLAVSVRNIQAGDNNIGNVDVVTLPALVAGTANIGDVDVLTLPALPAGTNNIGDVDVLTLPALPAGSNSIGKVTVNTAAVYRSETFSDLLEDGEIQDATAAPVSQFSLQVFSAAVAWTVSILTSLDGTTFTAVLTHTNADLTGVTKSVTGKPARYWRVSCSVLTALGSAVGNGLAMP